MDEIVERPSRKQIFVLSEGGKPILSSVADDETTMVTSGLLQALAGIATDAGDTIKCLQAGGTKIVYIYRRNVYFVAISSTDEPEAVLEKHLCFLYSQMLFILTSAFHGVLENNPSKDMRQLIGNDTIALISSSFEKERTAASVALTGLETCTMDKSLRETVVQALTAAVMNSGSIAGLLLCGHRLVGYYLDITTGVTISTNDLLLLSHFVAESKALRYHDENWVPICLPDFNSDAFMQAYISHFMDHGEKSNLSLVLLSADHENFRHMHMARAVLEKALCVGPEGSIPNTLLRPININGDIFGSQLSEPPLHFMLKLLPPEGSAVPAQLVVASLSGEDGDKDKDLSARVWAQHMRHAICMRVGSSEPESCLMKSPRINDQSPRVLAHARAVDGVFSPERTPPPTNMRDFDGSGDCLRMFPVSDHALSFSALKNGPLCLSAASADSELYVTFPSTMTSLEACRAVNTLSKFLRPLHSFFFQTMN
jgi:hypothetical protein